MKMQYLARTLVHMNFLYIKLKAGCRPTTAKGSFIHYDFLKLNYIGKKMAHVSSLAIGAFSCNSHVTNVTLKTIKNTLV